MKLVLFFLFLSVAIVCADVKITDLPAASSATGTDVTVVVIDPGGSPVTKKITRNALLTGSLLTGGTASAIAFTGTAGTLVLSGPTTNASIITGGTASGIVMTGTAGTLLLSGATTNAGTISGGSASGLALSASTASGLIVTAAIASTGTTGLLASASAGTLRLYGQLKLDSPTATGTATAALGTASPATVTTPYVWLQATAPDGTTIFLPAWK